MEVGTIVVGVGMIAVEVVEAIAVEVAEGVGISEETPVEESYRTVAVVSEEY